MSVTCTGPFAGHRDWRLPEIDELWTIFDESAYDDYLGNCNATGACIDPVFGPTKAWSRYWSATTRAGTRYDAWGLNSGNDTKVSDLKTYAWPVRAVRGGSR